MMSDAQTAANQAASIITELLSKIATGELDASQTVAAQLEGAVIALRAMSGDSLESRDAGS